MAANLLTIAKLESRHNVFDIHATPRPTATGDAAFQFHDRRLHFRCRCHARLKRSAGARHVISVTADLEDLA